MAIFTETHPLQEKLDSFIIEFFETCRKGDRNHFLEETLIKTLKECKESDLNFAQDRYGPLNVTRFFSDNLTKYDLTVLKMVYEPMVKPILY